MKTVAINLLLFLAAAVSVTPFVWLVYAATHDSGGFTLGAFAELGRQQPFGRWMVNSIFLASTQSVAVVLVSSLGGFAMAKYRFVGRNFILMLLLGTLLLPQQVYLTSLYELMRQLGWLNSYWAILGPGTISVVGIILFREAMRGVPDEMLNAARLDGCGELRLWWEIALPLVRPVIGAFALISFLASWNGYLWPQIVLQDEGKYTLPMGLANMTSLGEFQGDYAVLMAGTLLGLAPAVLVFVVLQGEFLEAVGGRGSSR
jgi:lactose/L-arabinose transport system permease protein